MKNINKNQINKQGITTTTINLDSIYKDMNNLYQKRTQLQMKQKNIWKEVSKRKNDKSNQIANINKEIGTCTYKINSLINNLLQYKKTHKAMNLAYKYLNGEINRIENIIKSKKKTIKNVECGKEIAITPTGKMTTNTSELRSYVKQKEITRDKLMKCKIHVEKYLDKKEESKTRKDVR